MHDKCLALIPARGGSRGIPKKNIVDFCGKPLIAWTIDSALESESVGQVVVTTDDDEIADIARKYGAEVPFVRPPDLAADETPGMEPILHAIQTLDFSGDVAVLQPTSPLRAAWHIDELVGQARQAGALSAVSVRQSKEAALWRAMRQPNGFLLGNIEASPELRRRQDAHQWYVPNGAIYFGRGDRIIQSGGFLGAGCFLYLMSPLHSIDIDEAEDMIIAKCLMQYGVREAQSFGNRTGR